jgi:predicted ATP-grasp superfamily ATP-dependent carboligase
LLDPTLPVVVFRIGSYPLHHGTLGAIRALGRCRVPVHLVTESRFTPAACSRFVTDRAVGAIAASTPESKILDRLIHIGKSIGCPAMVLCTDDEAAVFVAEHAPELRAHFVLPNVPAELPRTLASKQHLPQWCAAAGLPSPRTWLVSSHDDVVTTAAAAGFPVIAKNAEPWTRLSNPAVSTNTVVPSPEALLGLSASWRDPIRVVIQEYIPAERSVDWIVHAYVGDAPSARLIFTGVKVRSWPSAAGATSFGRVVTNPELAALANRLFDTSGFRGIAALCWRYDERDGRYYLLDFNPRVGAQFRLFENGAGVDVVRAMHLDLSDREIPHAPVEEGRAFRDGFHDLQALLASGHTRPVAASTVRSGHIERAWLAADDPLPILLALAYRLGEFLTKLWCRTRRGVCAAWRSVQAAASTDGSLRVSPVALRGSRRVLGAHGACRRYAVRARVRSQLWLGRL